MTWTFIGRTDAEMPNLCVLSLTEGREYFFRVIAENRHGRSEPLESEVPVIPNRLFEAPPPPVTLEAINIGKDSLTLSWIPPEDASVTDYLVEIKTVDQESWSKVARVPNKVTNFSIKCLPEGAELLAQIIAENKYGASEPTMLNMPVKLENREGIPSALTSSPEVIQIGSNYVDLSWSAPESDGGQPILGYQVERLDSRGRCWLIMNKSPLSDTHFRVENLYGCTPYQFRVRAINSKGLSDPSPTTAPVFCHDRPKSEAPKFEKEFDNLDLEVGTSATFTCEVSGIPMPEITWYKNYRQIHDGRRHIIETKGNKQILTIPEVDFEDAGDIQCQARNKMGIASVKASLQVFAHAKVSLPAAYQHGLKFFEGDTLKIRLPVSGKPAPDVMWAKDGKVIKKDKRTKIQKTDAYTTLIIDDVTKSDGGVYHVNISNYYGDETIDISVTIIGAPDAPGKPQVSKITDHTVHLIWAESSSEKHSPATGYIVEKRDLSTGVWRYVTSTNVCYADVDCLEEYKQYQFQIRAENLFGLSLPSEHSDTIITRKAAEKVDYDELYDATYKGKSIDINQMRGDVLSKYIICEELGRGAFGVVHRAVERATGKNWAAKFIKCRPNEKEAVRREIDLMNSLHHRKLLQLHEAFDQPGEIVMILEFLSGGELFDRLVSNNYIFTEEDCIIYMRQICQGVQHMHRQNIIHLDLKPENVMCVTKDNTDIKLIDFGLAQKIEEGKSIKVLFGTAEFCSPEIINYEPVSFSSDMWSLGVVAYMLLSGYSPFAGDNDQETFTYINHVDFDFDDEVWDYVSDDAKDFIANLLLRDKRERMTIDDALNHPWLNPQETMDLIDGEAQRNLKKIELSTENHKDYLYRTRNKNKEFDLLPIGCLARDSAIFRREGDKGILARELVMEMPEFAPEVIDHLMDMTGCEGRKVEFKCTIIGKPEPKITWYKDGDEIIPTRRTRLSYNDGVSSLFLSDLNLSDAGSYSCKAVNKFGHISTSSDLDIQEVRHRRKKKEGLDLESRYITYDDSHVDPYSPPIIVLPLVDEARNMGDNVDFNIKVRSHTPVEVTWRHYEDVILPSEKFKLKKDIDEFHLHISDLNLDDGGRWQCRAVNSYGQSETTCKLTVHNYTLEKYRVPEFTQELHNFVVSEGAEARFICKISAHPEPEVTWYKNRQPIENKGPYRFTQTSDDTFILVIDEVVREDIGYYMCQAVNTAGSKSTEAKLAVETVEKPLSLLERNPLQRGRIKSERFGSKKNKYAHAPEFTTKLKSKSVPAESTVKLSCTVSGVPEPDIQWYKNGEKIYSSLNCCMRNNSGLVSLEIAVAAHENEGQYVCEASNSEGTVSCSAQITVEGDKKPVADSSESEAPVFIETPLCSTVVIGRDAVFQCVTKGNPMPSFKWTKDGLNVDENDHCSLFVDSHGGCRLVIHNVQESDAGLYMCVAHNTMGRTKCSTRLRVVGQDEAHEHQGLSGTRAIHHSRQKFEKVPDPDISNRMMMSGRPPYFTLMLPKLIELNEGDKLRLDCSLEGYPSPVVTWQKGVRELVYDARHRIIAYGTLQTLEIPSVLIMDHGEYFVRAANVFGIIESSCLVKVNKKGRKMAEREYNKMKFPASLPYDAADGDAPLQGDKEKPLVEPKGQAPFFIKHLPHTIDVIEGTDLRLDCTVKAKPKIEKSDIEGDYHRVEGGVTGEEKERGESRTLEPAGDMTSGHASAEVTSSTAAAAAVSSEEQTKKTDPSFTDKFDDTVVTEGEDAVLECKTSGDSDIRWLKDGEVIYSTDRISLIRKGCLHQLYIHRCTKADQAMYTCFSSTSNQSEACVAMLSVRRKTPTEDWDTSYADDLLKKWETKKFGSSYVGRSREKSYSPHRRSYDPSPERDRRYRSSSRDSDIYSPYGKYSGTSYDKYSDYSRTSGRYSSYERPTERYSRYDQPTNYSRASDRYSRYDMPTDRYSRDRYSSERYSTDKYSADKYSTDKYSADKYSTDKYSANRYSTDKYSADRYSTDKYSADRYSSNRYSADRYSADRYSTDRYSADRYSTDRYSAERYSTNRYSAERYSTDRYSADKYSTDRYSRDRYSRDRYSSERYLSPKPRQRFSSHERDYYSGNSQYEDKKVSKTSSSTEEDKEKTSDLISEIKGMKLDIEIRIEQADELMKDETDANKRMKKEKIKTDGDVKTTDTHEKPDKKTLDSSMKQDKKAETYECLDYKKVQKPSEIEKKEVNEILVYRAVEVSTKEQEKKEEVCEKLDYKTIKQPTKEEEKKEETFEKLDKKIVEAPKIVETKKDETFEKLDHKTVEAPKIVETKKDETFEKLDHKTVEAPKIVETKKDETFEKLDHKTVEAPKIVETKKEETFEKLDKKIVEAPKIVETKKDETFEKLDHKTVEAPKIVETKKEETFEKLDHKTVEAPKIVETKKEETFEKLDHKTVEAPKIVETKKEETFEKLDHKTVEAPKIVETKKEETFEKLDHKTVEAPKLVETKKEETFEKLDHKTVEAPKIVKTKKEETFEKLDHKTVEAPKLVETKKEETFEKLDHKTVEAPKLVETKKEETFEKLDHKTVEAPKLVESKKEETFEKLDHKTVEAPKLVETKKEETFEKLDHKTVEAPKIVETKKEETFEKLDHKTVEAPKIVETKKEETFEKLDHKTVEAPKIVETKKEETFEKLDHKTVEVPKIVESVKEETFEKLDHQTVKMPSKLDEKKKNTFDEVDHKTVEGTSIVEGKKEETFEKLDHKTVEMPSKLEENEDKTVEKLDHKTAEGPKIAEAQKEETFQKLDHKSLETPTKVEVKNDVSQDLEYKAVDLPTHVQDKVELDKKMEAPISVVEDTKSDITKMKDDKLEEKKLGDLSKVVEQVPVYPAQLESGDKINLSDEENAKELIQEARTVDEQSSSDLSKQSTLSSSERIIKNEDNEYEIIMCPEKEVIIEEFPTFSMPPQDSVEDVRRESSEQMGTVQLEDAKTITKDEPVDEIKTMSEQKLDTKTKDVEMGKVITIDREKIQTSVVKDVEKSESTEAKEVSLLADEEVSGSHYQNKKDAVEEEKVKSISEKEPTITVTKENDTSTIIESSQIDDHSLILADGTDIKEKNIEVTEDKVQQEANVQAEVFDTHESKISEVMSTPESEIDLSTQYAHKLSSELDDKKTGNFLEDEKNKEKIGHIDPELENFAQSIVKKILEDELKQQLKAESKETLENKCFEDKDEDEKIPEEKTNVNQAVIIVDMDSEDDERDMGQQKNYIVELPPSPADRKHSINEIPDDEQYFIHGSGSPGSPVIEELLSPFRTSEDGQQGIIEEPSEDAIGQEITTSSDRENEADKRLTFDKKFNFESNNVDQDVFEGRPLDKETHQMSQKEEASTDTEEDLASTGKRCEKDYMEKESGQKTPSGLDADAEKKMGDCSERKDADGYGADSGAATRETQVSASNEGKQLSGYSRNGEVVIVDDYEDKSEISSEKNNSSDLQQQSEISQKEHSSRQSSFTTQTPESRSSTSSEQVGTATGNYKIGRNLTSDDLPAEDDGVWTRKPIFSEDSLSYVSEQTSLSGDSHRGLETESNRTSSLERQLSDDETFLLRQTSDESGILQRQSSDEVNVLQTQSPEYSYSSKRQKPDESLHKQTSKDAGIFYTESTQNEGIFQRESRESLAQHLGYSGSAQQEKEEYKTTKRDLGDYEEQENVQSDYQEECLSEYSDSEAESEGSDVTTQTAIINKNTGEFSTTATESMDDDVSDQSDSRKVKSTSPMSQDVVSRPPRFKSPGIEEMLKDRQFPPIFVKDLPRLLEAKIGDDLKMSCVIRYIAQIEWKKSGDKITRDRRRRMISDDDGTQTLHVRAIQSDDSGIYTCIAKESDGTISQTECVVIIRAGKKAE